MENKWKIKNADKIEIFSLYRGDLKRFGKQKMNPLFALIA